ncbi:cation:proton antiporter [Luteolibacter sp. GHJ8]|uniref:Cation:proton antiporter n=1 Tax=Luteolibacter rhizosphaerae TaxID=2989719 RepID=A0ABT3G6W2_9BACT|nr:cation:proton antiporter [Luteolibacter rhizosphaerae]MCW1915224.1 cation:proton antiporter [Luteolibacter rhizosphaerae]
MHDLILTFTGGLGAAVLLGFISHRMGLSPIVGYLLAGIVVSPHTPGFVADRHLAEQMAHIGVILLMFGVGLHFHFKELLAVKRIAVPGAVVQSAVATILSMLIMRAFGWSWTEGAVFGMAIAVASTVVLTRILVDNNHLHTPTGHIAIGWLVVEDIFTVFVLVLLPAIFGGDANAGGGGIAMALVWTTLKIGALIAFTFIVGGWAIPRLLTLVARTGSRELFTLTILVLALGIAVGSAKFFGVSMELGAFLAGMVVGRSEFSNRAAIDALPMKDAFAVLFFVSVGMLFDLKSFLDNPWLAAATLAIVVIGKPLAAIAITIALRYPLRTALSVGAVLSQIGEFSFIVATLGMQYGVVNEQAFNALVATAILSITLSPLLYKAVGPVERWVAARPALWKLLNRVEIKDNGDGEPESDGFTRRALVVGYGPVGRTLARLLKDNGFSPVIVEMNVDTVQGLKSSGERAFYGDASHPETLKSAGAAKADILILSASSVSMGREVIIEAKRLNPSIKVLVRTSYLREADELLDAGADEVFSGEGEVALSMTESVLRGFGATAEQLDRENERVRREFFPHHEPAVR